jgi:3-oxoacyl-[acyl-carrier-protein] synthase II
VTDAVVVSGLGTVGAHGAGRDGLAEALRLGATALSEVGAAEGGLARPDGARLAALATGVDLSRWLKPAAARRMSGPSKLAVAAARMALEDAGLGPDAGGWADTAVFVATAFGPSAFTERLFRTIAGDGPEAASPFHFTESVANAPAAQVAIDCQARGPNVTVTQREAGPLIALERAVREVAEGRASRALAGSVEEISPVLHALLDGFGALARATRDLKEAARPFDRRRNGFVAGEGASILVLERESEVRARGGRMLARVVGGASAFDTTASRVGWGKGAGPLAGAVERLLRRTGTSAGDVSVVVSGASGSSAGDRLEADVLRRVFDARTRPPVAAPKAVTGEYGGGLVGAAVLVAHGGELGPTPGFGEPDPECGIVPHAGGRPAPGRVLVSSLAAGGAAAWIILEPA